MYPDRTLVLRAARRLPAALALVSSLVLAPAVARAGIWGNGVNLQPSYYNNGNPTLGWSLMNANTKIKTVRIEIEPDKVAQAKTWIAGAKANGKTIIATYHKSSVLGSDSTSELTAAGNWWKTNYAGLNAAGSLTVNLMNEWGSHNLSANAYASAYNSAISLVRQVYGGRIVIDASGWGQETAICAGAIKGTNGTKISDTNIVPSVHIYPGAWNQAKNAWLATGHLADLASAGRGGLVGEFGNGGSGSCDWSGCTNYARSTLGWTVLGWCWNGDGGSMNMCSPAWVSNPTASTYAKSSYWSTVYDRL